MSTLEEIPLQAADSKEEEDGSTTHTEPLEPDDSAQISTVKEAGAPVTRSRWMTIFTTVTTLIAYAFLNAGISMIAPFYPFVAQQYNVPVYIAGFVIGVAPLFVTLLSPIIGYFLPHLGLKFTQLAGLFLAGGSLILFGFVSMMPSRTSFLAFSFLLRIVGGIGTAMYATASYTQLTQFYPDKKGTIVSLMELALILGFSGGPAVGGGLQQAAGFLLPFLVVGGLTLALIVLLIVLLPPTECESVKLPWRLLLKLLTNIMFALIVVCLVLAMTIICAVFAYLGKFLHAQFNLSFGMLGLTYLGIELAHAVGIFSAGPITDKLKKPRYLIIGGLLVAFASIVFVGPPEFITSPQLWLSIVAWIICQIGLAFAIVPVYADVYGIAKMVSEDEASISSGLSGIIVGSISAGECLGPIIGGSLVYRVGFRSMTAIFSLVLLVYALVLIIATVIHRVWRTRTCWKFNKTNSEQCN